MITPHLTPAELQVIGLSLQIAMETLTAKLAVAVAQHNVEQQAAQETEEEADING